MCVVRSVIPGTGGPLAPNHLVEVRADGDRMVGVDVASAMQVSSGRFWMEQWICTAARRLRFRLCAPRGGVPAGGMR